MYIKISTALNSQKKSVRGSKILFLGVAYKPDIDDERESPALEILDLVAHKGGEIKYHDPYISNITTKHGIQLSSVELSKEVLRNSDCVVITTNHSSFDDEFIQTNSFLLVDLRNMVRASSPKVFKL